MIKKLITTMFIALYIISTVPIKVWAVPQTPTGWYKSWCGSINLGVHRWEYFEKNENGYYMPVKGWKYIDGYWYYFNPGTADTEQPEAGFACWDMQTGWIKDNGKWYFCYYNGHMAHDCWIDHWYLGSDGAWDGNVDDESLKQYNSRTFYGLCMADEEQTDILYTNNSLNNNGHKITKRQLERFEEEKKVSEGTLYTQWAQGDGSDRTAETLKYLTCYNPWEEYEPLKQPLAASKVYVDSSLEEGYQVTVTQLEKFKSENRLCQITHTESTPSGQTIQAQVYYLLW